MHTNHKLKSMLLMIGTVFSFIAISNINKVFADEPGIIAIIYISENCSECDSIIEIINSMISDSLYIDERNISESATAAEYELIRDEYEITSTSLPLLVTQNGGFTTETKITREIEKLIELLETTDKENIEEEVVITEESEVEINDHIEIEQEPLQTTVSPEVVEATNSPFIALFSIAIPVFMIWAAFFVIKKLNL